MFKKKKNIYKKEKNFCCFRKTTAGKQEFSRFQYVKELCETPHQVRDDVAVISFLLIYNVILWKAMKKKTTFEELAALWEADKRPFVKKSTSARYTLLIRNHLLPTFARMTDITEEKVQAFVMMKLNSGLGRKSVKDIVIVLKMILKFGVRQRLISHREIEVRFPAERMKEDLKILDLDDQKRFMNYLKLNASPANLGIFICLSAGLRIGEVCGLRWEDIDTQNGVIRIRRTLQRIYIVNGSERHTEIIIGTPKSINSNREIPMTAELLSILKRKRTVVPSHYILTDSPRPNEPRTYRNHYNRLIRQLGIPKLKFHGLRHSFATRCIENQCDYKTVSSILGHSNISTTLNLYVHPNMDQKKKCIEQMSQGLR